VPRILDGRPEIDQRHVRMADARIHSQRAGNPRARTSSRSRGQPLVMWPTQPSFWWMVAVTSPNWGTQTRRVIPVPADRDLGAGYSRHYRR